MNQDDQIHEEREADEACALMAGWMLEDEIEYQTRLATSYPQDISAKRAAKWLTLIEG